MTWDEPIRFIEPRGNDTAHIVEMLGAVDVDLDPTAVHLLISLARQAHQRCLSDWLHRNEPGYMGPPAVGPYAQWERRRRKNPGRFRDGSDLPVAPYVAIYALCNRFYRHELDLPFWCDFRALHLGEDYEGLERLEFINPPALFFTLIAEAVDFRSYTADRCKRVHRAYYKRLLRIP